MAMRTRLLRSPAPPTTAEYQALNSTYVWARTRRHWLYRTTRRLNVKRRSRLAWHSHLMRRSRLAWHSHLMRRFCFSRNPISSFSLRSKRWALRQRLLKSLSQGASPIGRSSSDLPKWRDRSHGGPHVRSVSVSSSGFRGTLVVWSGHMPGLHPAWMGRARMDAHFVSGLVVCFLAQAACEALPSGSRRRHCATRGRHSMAFRTDPLWGHCGYGPHRHS